MTAALRRAVAERDGWACCYCQRSLFETSDSPVRSWSEHGQGPRAATLDHYDPTPVRGRNQLANLRLACRSCNSAKGARPPGPWVERWMWWLANIGPIEALPTWAAYEKAAA